MRRQRRLRPGAWWSVVVRCTRQEFRLRPDEERTQAVGYFVSKALIACPGIRLVAVCQMSNHIHIVLRDDRSELSKFMCRFESPLAKFLNKLDGTSGQVFSKRFSAIETIDKDAVLDRIAYSVTNPVKDGLVPSLGSWPGVVVWAGNEQDLTFSRPRYIRSKNSADVPLELSISRDVLSDSEITDLKREISNRITALVRQRGRTRFLGRKRVLLAAVFDSPSSKTATPMPICHASSFETWWDYVLEWRVFRAAYRKASDAFRAGDWSVHFPAFSFRPWTPLLQGAGQGS